MKISKSLLAIMFRQVLGVTLIALPVGCLYVLFTREVLIWQNAWLGLFVLAHSIAIAVCLGRFRSRGFAFIYTRGYSRDALWGHKMLVTVLAVFSVWVPMVLVLWLGFRSSFQDVVYQSPYFPIMAIREAQVPWVWLAGYGILLPLFHYVWIRRAQPMRGGNGVAMLAVGVVFAIITLMSFRWHPVWFRVVMWSASAIIVGATLLGGRLLHRQLEVHV